MLRTNCSQHSSIDEHRSDRVYIVLNDEHTANIIMHCRQSILFSNGSSWPKKSSPQFDVAMGSFDGAEVCELVGLYVLYHLSSVIGDKMNIGLYRDDGLAILEATSGPETDRIRKKIEKLLKDHNLQITTELGLIQTNFLDVTFNLKSGKYWPYRKPNDQPLYVNAGSNHPPMIKKQTAQHVVQALIRAFLQPRGI